MKGDFTRDTFDPAKHFSRVLMQQGRVQLDTDWNEQAAILLHYLQTLAADLIGPHGGPGDGFKIKPVTTTLPNDFVIEPGIYYVDGIRCELDATPVSVVVQSDATKLQVLTLLVDNWEFEPGQYIEVFPRPPSPAMAKITAVDPVQRILTLDQKLLFPTLSPPIFMIRRVSTYGTQPDYPLLNTDRLTGKYLVYLDVWERHISYLEDGGDINIREVALGGPDTAARAKVVWQVKVRKSGDPQPTEVEKLLKLSQAMLRARAKQTQPPSSPCVIHPDARYRGAENQLYRVEIHTGGKVGDISNPPPTFKWSRENGSVVFPIVAPIASGDGKTTVTLAHLGHDDKLGLREGDWAEIVDDDYTLQNRAEPLLKVHTIDRDALIVTLDSDLPPKVGSDPSKHLLLRRWDYQEKKDRDPKQGGLPFSLGKDNAVLIVEKDGEDGPNWFVLEDGVQIQFQPGGEYRTGDYWLIPARTVIGDVEWPGPADSPKAIPPHGVEHHYAPLASISVDAITGDVTVSPRYRRIINQLWTPES